MVSATFRKNSSMYDKDVGSYCIVVSEPSARGEVNSWTHVYRVCLGFLISVRVATFGEQTIWKQR